MMKFKVDENLPAEVVDSLRGVGHDVLTVFDQHLNGEPDPVLASVVTAEGRCLVTMDLDFADIRAYLPTMTSGIIVLRPRIQSIPRVVALMPLVTELLKQESPHHRLWVV